MANSNQMQMNYDGTERRVYKKDIVSGVTTEVLYLHDGMNAIVEKDKNGNSTEYVYGPTGIIFIKTATQTNFVLKDHLGSIRATINTAELPYAAVGYDYSAFGTILSTVSNSGYFFTGQEYDKTSGLHNFKARMYDSDLAMFYGGDPAEQGNSPFAYAGNNPIMRVDKNGKFWMAVLAAAYVGGYWGGVRAHESHTNIWEGIITGGVSGAAGGATGAAFGNVYGIVSNGIVGAISAGISSSVNAAITGQNTNSIGNDILKGGITAAAFSAIDIGTSLLAKGQQNDIGYFEGQGKISDPDFVGKALNSMETNGGQSGKVQSKLLEEKAKIGFTNSKMVSLAHTAIVPKTWKDALFGGLFFEAELIPYIELKPQNIFDPHYKADKWLEAGIDPSDYISKTVEILYHESAHAFGLFDFSPKYGPYRYYSPSELDHHSMNYEIWDHKIGQLTKNWIMNVYLPNKNGY
ncbi:RHS repeat-associated core domain-containing protein [bacterium]|nr:RHS repeat-associated core domain-containing protein [bacterium]